MYAVRINGVCTRIGRRVTHRRRTSDHQRETLTDKPWRERPCRTALRVRRARSRWGRSRHGLCAHADHHSCHGRQKPPPDRASRSLYRTRRKAFRSPSPLASCRSSDVEQPGERRLTRGQPLYVRSSPGLSSTVSVTRRRPGRRDEGTGGRAGRIRRGPLGARARLAAPGIGRPR